MMEKSGSKDHYLFDFKEANDLLAIQHYLNVERIYFCVFFEVGNSFRSSCLIKHVSLNLTLSYEPFRLPNFQVESPNSMSGL